MEAHHFRKSPAKKTRSTKTGQRIYLNDQLVDMNKAVTLIVNGKQLYRGYVKPTLQDMINSCTEYFDPCRIFPASIEVGY